MSDTVRIAAVGDLMLVGEWEELFRDGACPSSLHALRLLLDEHDVVFANLETTSHSPAGCIPKQPRVVTSASVIRNSVERLGVNVANLANNHAFDSYFDGFRRTRQVLEESGVCCFGAGENISEASRPGFVECSGIRFGWLGYADFDTRPSHVAGSAAFGINPLVEEAVVADVSRLAGTVDHVIVSIHWGVEFCHVPSPHQIRLARHLIESGASLVVGHHAHVVQGIERYGRGAIAYNLGNLTTSDFWIQGRLAIRQTTRTRSSVVLSASFTKTALQNVRAVPARSVGSRILVDDKIASRILARANGKLSRGVSPACWRLRRLYEDVLLRTAWKLDPRVIRSVQARHVQKAFRNLSSAIRGQGPA